MRQDHRYAESDFGDARFAGIEKGTPPTPQEIYFEIGLQVCVALLAALIFEILLSGT